ncbi:hypothetical protein Hanom_Chr16g01419181 [Helianthus anomalus]
MFVRGLHWSKCLTYVSKQDLKGKPFKTEPNYMFGFNQNQIWCLVGVQMSRAARELLEIGSRKSSKRAEPYRARAELEPKTKPVCLSSPSSSLACEAR